jgi:hypothetical protein
MMERVIYCILSCAALLAERPHTVLLQLPAGSVVAVDDAVLLELYTRLPTIPLLYFSRGVYEEALRDLPLTEMQAAIAKRHTEWSPQALDQILNWLYLRQRAGLTLNARGRAGSSVQVVQGLDGHFRETVEMLSRLVGQGRYEDVDFAELLVFAVEKEALLIAELQALDGEARTAVAAELHERTQTVQVVAQALAGKGRPEYGQALPYAELWRALYIAPADAPLLAQLKAEFESFPLWREGLVTRWPVRLLTELQQTGKTVELLYYDSGEFLEDYTELTPAQLHRTFAARAQAALQPQARHDYLNGLRLEALLLWRTIHARSTGEERRWREALDKILDVQTTRLIATLANDGSWLVGGTGSGRPSLSALLKLEEDIVQEVVFFHSLARQSGREDLAQRLLSILSQKQAQVARLKAFPQR